MAPLIGQNEHLVILVQVSNPLVTSIVHPYGQSTSSEETEDGHPAIQRVDARSCE